MSDAAPDQVTAYLAEVREAVRQRDELLPRMPVDVSEFNAAQDRLAEPAPRLLAAVEAALKHHQPGKLPWCDACGPQRQPCQEMADIRSALLGEGE